MIRTDKIFRITFVLLLSLVPASLHPLFAGNEKNIVLYEYTGPYFELTQSIDTISSEGTFRFTEQNKHSRCIYFNYSIYRCYFFTEPGQSYIVSLPDLERVDEEEISSPFFKRADLHVKIKAEKESHTGLELNDAIRRFDAVYEPFLSRQALRYYNTDYARAKLDSFSNVHFKNLPAVSSQQYYNQYIRSREAMLKFHGNRQNIDTLIRDYIYKKPVRFEIPPYRELFSNVLSDYFDHLRRKENFESVYSEFTRLSPTYLADFLKKDDLLQNDTIRELVILKECYNAYYGNKIDKKKLIAFTREMKQKSKLRLIKETAIFLLNKFTYLQNGYVAPDFKASGVNGDSLKLITGDERIIYLGFCNLQSLDCLKEIEYLKYLHAKHQRFIRIITILKAPAEAELKNFSQQKGVEWEIIPWKDNTKIPELYEIRNVPSFFLIEPDGMIIRNPAAYPSENFEQKLFRILRSRGIV